MNTVNGNAVKNANGATEKKEAPQIKLPPPLHDEIVKPLPTRPPGFGQEPRKETQRIPPCGFGTDDGKNYVPPPKVDIGETPYRPPGSY